MPGPVPKRSDARRRRNKPVGAVPVKAVSSAPAALKWPEPTRGRPVAARRWYGSLRRSGQAQFYEASDVALAQIGAELVTRALEDSNAAMAAAALKVMDELLTSEGARRRARVE